MTKAKENEVSRRDFIKDLGGGAIGAAIISTELLAPRPVDAAGDDKIVVGPKMNMGTVGPKRWKEITDLTDEMLKQFGPLGARQLNWRLNDSNTPNRQPRFIDWVATPDVTKQLEEKSGVKALRRERRLGDGVLSSVYNSGLQLAGKEIVVRDWMKDCTLLVKEKRVESQLLVPKAGLMHQRFAGIFAQEQEGKKQRRLVGLLTVSFQTTPANHEDVDKLMKNWASWPPNYPKSRLVDFIEQNFVLGGPPYP